MLRVAWKKVIIGDQKDEYKRRHDEIWPEMTDALNQAGIHNYTIWNVGNELFGYYEVEDVEACNKVMRESPVVQRWNVYMESVIRNEIDPETGKVPELELMFLKS